LGALSVWEQSDHQFTQEAVSAAMRWGCLPLSSQQDVTDDTYEPAPAAGDQFASRVAALGNDHVVIGAMQDNAGATDAGSVYLFSVPASPPAPSLTIQLTAPNAITVSWPSPSTGFVLQQNTSGVSSVNWSNVTDTIQGDGTTKSLTVGPSGASRFYRLLRP
jgi:hypothetical protein